MAEVFTRDNKELGENLWTLRNEKIFCDASISINDQKFPVHAVVLGSNSQFFKKTFHDSEIFPKEVTFVDINVEVIQMVIEYCYKGSIKITENNVSDVYKIANVLEMSRLIEICGKNLKKFVNFENSLALWKIVKCEYNKSSRNDVFKFIEENFDKVSNSNSFLALEFSDIKELLSSKLKTESAKEIYDAMKKWIKHDSSRSDHLNDLLDFVKLECLPKDLLISESLSICNANATCFEKFLKAVASHGSVNQTDCSSLKTLLVMGGETEQKSKIIEVFDLNKKEWFKINYNQIEKVYFEIAIVENKLMIIGGYHGGAVNTCHYYDLKTGQTESLPPMKYKRQLAASVVFDKCVYVFGGHDGGKYLSAVEKWTPSSRTWKDVAPMSIIRWKLVTAVLDDEIFAVGGVDGGELSLTEAYNPTKNTWRRCSDMNEKRSDPVMAVVGGFLYVFGGWRSVILKTAEKYDKSIDKWTMIQPLSSVRSASAMGVLNGQVVIVGGFEDGLKISSLVEAYDEDSKKWKTLASLKQNRYFHRVIDVPWSLAEKLLERKT